MSQLTRGEQRRLMYVESKGGEIDGFPARVGWVRFSKSGRSIYYRGLTLTAIGGSGVAGNFIDAKSGIEFWVSGVKLRGSNAHPGERGIRVAIDDDAASEYAQFRAGA